ncbi:hypothetical protein V1507DRAFT_44525 [Lipomyces tetrasporus]
MIGSRTLVWMSPLVRETSALPIVNHFAFDVNALFGNFSATTTLIWEAGPCGSLLWQLALRSLVPPLNCRYYT